MFNPNHDIAKDQSGSDLLTTKYLGEVVDVQDPLREGRCRVKVFSLFDTLAVEDIPWAIPSQKPAFFGQDAKAGSISIPKKGAVVSIKFNNGDLYSPEYEQVQEIGDDIKEELRKSSDFEYEGAHYILFDGDQELKLWFNRSRGLTLGLKDSYVNIGQDSKIEIYHKDGLSSIELAGGAITVQSQSEVNVISNSINATANSVSIEGKQSVSLGGGSPLLYDNAVLGKQLFTLLTGLASMIDLKMPASPGAATAMVKNMQELVLSKTVTLTI